MPNDGQQAVTSWYSEGQSPMHLHGSHARAMELSRALHVAVAAHIEADPSLIDAARARVAKWLRDGSTPQAYALAWSELLNQSTDDLVKQLGARTERMHELRQVSPFAGALSPRERWRIHKEAAATPSRGL